jgi:hypothetical protein
MIRPARPTLAEVPLAHLAFNLALDFLLFGRGDVRNRVVDLLDDAIADPDKRPTVIVG